MDLPTLLGRPRPESAETHQVKLGYAGPDPSARSLRRGSTGTLGVVLGEHLSYAFDDPILTAVQATKRPAVVHGGPAVPGLELVSIDNPEAARAVGGVAFAGANVTAPSPAARTPRVCSSR